MLTLGRSDKISPEERKKDFLGVEGMPFVTGAEEGQFPQYVPRSMNEVRKNTGPSILAITQAKRHNGMYPIQKFIAQLFGSHKKDNGKNN